MRFTYYGHACFSLEIQGKHLLFDPFILENKLASDANIKLSELQADYILLSHAHHDHVADAEKIAHLTKAPIVAMVEVAGYFGQKGLETVGMNLGGTLTLQGTDITVSMQQALHSSSFADGSYGGNPAGFIIEVLGSKKVYYAGDTALFSDMQLFAANKPLDCVILPIGGHYTMDVKQAIKAADFLQCKQVIGLHYDTFPEIVIDQKAAEKAFCLAGKKLHMLGIGTSLNL